MDKISKAKCVELLTTHKTVFSYIGAHGKYTERFDDRFMRKHVSPAIEDAIKLHEQRTATKKSYGVRFNTGSELRLYGDKGIIECYVGKVYNVEYVYVFCGYAHMVYFIVKED